jgi:hypothetical protein
MLTPRTQMGEYHATASRDAAYARGDATLRREAERLGLGYRESGGAARRPRFGGGGGTRRGGDPRGLDADVDADGGVKEDDRRGGAEGDEVRRERRRREREAMEKADEEAEAEALAHSPLRAKARKAAREISQMYLARSAGVGG